MIYVTLKLVKDAIREVYVVLHGCTSTSLTAGPEFPDFRLQSSVLWGTHQQLKRV